MSNEITTSNREASQIFWSRPGWSGGGACGLTVFRFGDDLDPIAECHTKNELWQLVLASRRGQLFCAALSSLKTKASAVLSERQCFDRIVGRRTVAKVLSIGLVSRMRFLGADLPLLLFYRSVWCDHRDRETGSTIFGQADA